MHRPFLYLCVSILALCFSCKPYEPLPVPPYRLNEPALDSPTLTTWITNGWRLQRTQFIDNSLPPKELLQSLPTDIISLARDRPYFFLDHPDSSQRIVVSTRHFKFEKVLNFRDIGGIRAADGRQIRWGKIYRSGKLEELKAKEFKALKSLGVKTVVDLRTVGEVEHAPDNLPAGEGVNWFHVSISGITDADLQRTKKDIKKQRAEDFNGAGKMETVMERFALEGAQDFGRVFELLLNEENTGLVYHCTAGKDRTGLLTALILYSLGVSEEVIMQDYLLSNYYRHDKIERNARLGAHILGIETEASRAIMDVRPNYLNASLNIIIKEYGSVDNYLESGLGLTSQDLVTLKNMYLY